jgi:hypothetical protein
MLTILLSITSSSSTRLKQASGHLGGVFLLTSFCLFELDGIGILASEHLLDFDQPTQQHLHGRRSIVSATVIWRGMQCDKTGHNRSNRPRGHFHGRHSACFHLARFSQCDFCFFGYR